MDAGVGSCTIATSAWLWTLAFGRHRISKAAALKTCFSDMNAAASIGLYIYSTAYSRVALGFPLLRGHHHLGNSRMVLPVLPTYGERKLLAIQWKT